MGKHCTIKFTHTPGEKGVTYVNIFAITDMDAEETAKAVADGLVPENDAFEFSLDAFNQELFDKLPKWQQEKIATSDEYKRANGIAIPDGTFKIPADDKATLAVVYPNNKELIDSWKKDNGIHEEGNFTEATRNNFKAFMLENGVDFDAEEKF